MATRSRDTETADTGTARTEDRGRQPDDGWPRELLDRARRVGPAVLGGALVVAGLRRRSLGGGAITLVGGWLLVLGLRGTGRDDQETKPADAPERDAPAVSRSVIVGRSADELYDLWRDPDQFSRIVGSVAEVTAVDDDRYRWVVEGPLDRTLTWETRVVDLEPGEHLRWETTGDGPVPNTGSVRFRPAPGDRGTEVTLTVTVDPPGGALGDAALERLDPVAGAFVGEVLGRSKSLAETGEVPTLEGNPSGRGAGDLV